MTFRTTSNKNQGLLKVEEENNGTDLLASFINICGNLDGRVRVVDVVLEVWIVNELQFDVGGVLHLPLPIQGILE